MAGAPRRHTRLSFTDALDAAARNSGVERYGNGFNLLAEVVSAFEDLRSEGNPSATFNAVMQIMPYAFPKRASVSVADGTDDSVSVDTGAIASRLDDMLLGDDDDATIN